MKVEISNIPISDYSDVEILQSIEKSICERSKFSLCYVNVHTINVAQKTQDFFSTISQFTIIYPDGVGIYLASKFLCFNASSFFLGKNVTEFYHKLLELSEKKRWSIFILGEVEQILSSFQNIIQKQYPHSTIVGFHHGFFQEDETPSILSSINQSKADILFMAMGTPKQELWFTENKKEIKIPVTCCVGGFISFVSGAKKRAPLWMRTIGLEWFYRLLQEPKRLWKRYIIGIPLFVYYILRQKITMWRSNL